MQTISVMYMNYRETWQQSKVADKITYRHILRCPQGSSFPGPPGAGLLGQNPQSLFRESLFDRAEDSLAVKERWNKCKSYYRVNVFPFYLPYIYLFIHTLPSLFLLASVGQLVNCESKPTQMLENSCERERRGERKREGGTDGDWWRWSFEDEVTCLLHQILFLLVPTQYHTHPTTTSPIANSPGQTWLLAQHYNTQLYMYLPRCLALVEQ